MQNDPVKHLIDEHVEILAKFAELQTAIDRLEKEGKAALTETLPTFQGIGQMMATQLEHHARKEDEVLFPAMEAVIGREGPTAVMRQEHKDIHAQGMLLQATLHELNQVEHPQIEANGERLRELSINGENPDDLCATGKEILRLVKTHFEKEEQILFPMAYNFLDAEEMKKIGTIWSVAEEIHLCPDE